MLDAHAALLDEAPTLKYFVVWGGPYEGVHGIFDAATELQPLIEMPGTRAYGATDGVTTKEFAEVKLRALQSARAAQQWRDARPPPGYRTYTFRNGMRVPVVWLFKVPLYGEVDAGRWVHLESHGDTPTL